MAWADAFVSDELMLGLFISYSGLFHSMLYVDYDWRYQLPAMLAGWLLAGFALIDSVSTNPQAGGRCMAGRLLHP